MKKDSEYKLSEITHGLIAYNPIEPDEIIHFCGYWNYPGKNSRIALYNELKTDLSFGLIGIPFVIRDATKTEVEEYKQYAIDSAIEKEEYEII